MCEYHSTQGPSSALKCANSCLQVLTMTFIHFTLNVKIGLFSHSDLLQDGLALFNEAV